MKPLEWLYSLGYNRSNLGLERINKLLQKLNNPQHNLKCIHVAGTNGKGSVCAILSSILSQQGYKVGMYTSPHIYDFKERYQINGKEITHDDLDRIIESIKTHYTDETFFEVATAIAYKYFSEQEVDILVLETGMGGRLDATNVITPLVSVITNISLDHTQHLGKDTESIAYEKAGIIKQNIPIITLAKEPALTIIKKVAKEKSSQLILPKPTELSLGLKGSFQKINASLAIEAIKQLKKQGMDVSEDSIKEGLKKAYWPARFEFMEKNVLIDCAHNPAGIMNLKEELSKIRYKFDRIFSIIGILSDKDKKEMVKIVSEFSDYIIFAKPDSERASEPEELAKYTDKRHEIVYNVNNALKKAKKLSNKEDLIVIAGSIYLIGGIRK